MGGFDKGLDLTEMATYGNKISHLVTFGAAGERFKMICMLQTEVLLRI